MNESHKHVLSRYLKGTNRKYQWTDPNMNFEVPHGGMVHNQPHLWLKVSWQEYSK